MFQPRRFPTYPGYRLIVKFGKEGPGTHQPQLVRCSHLTWGSSSHPSYPLRYLFTYCRCILTRSGSSYVGLRVPHSCGLQPQQLRFDKAAGVDQPVPPRKYPSDAADWGAEHFRPGRQGNPGCGMVRMQLGGASVCLPRYRLQKGMLAHAM